MVSKHNKVVYFFWGPAGSGKTTSLVKYASRDCLLPDNKTIFLTNDDFTVGARSKLKIFAEMTGVDYKFLPIGVNPCQIAELTVYDTLFFDLYIVEPTISIDNLISGFAEYFHIKKIFVLNTLFLPYTNLVVRLSGFDADEFILTFVDYIPKMAESKIVELDRYIRRLSKSMPLWISDGPIVPRDFYKFYEWF